MPRIKGKELHKIDVNFFSMVATQMEYRDILPMWKHRVFQRFFHTFLECITFCSSRRHCHFFYERRFYSYIIVYSHLTLLKNIS